MKKKFNIYKFQNEVFAIRTTGWSATHGIHLTGPDPDELYTFYDGWGMPENPYYVRWIVSYMRHVMKKEIKECIVYLNTILITKDKEIEFDGDGI